MLCCKLLVKLWFGSLRGQFLKLDMKIAMWKLLISADFVRILCPISLCVANSRAFVVETISFNNSLWVSWSCILSMNVSLIREVSSSPRLQFSACSIKTFYWFHYLLFRWREDKTILSDIPNYSEWVVQSRRSSMNGSFSIWKWGCLLLNMRQPSVPMHKIDSETAFWSPIPQGLSPHKIPISSIFLLRFCHFTFNCWLRTFRSPSVAGIWFFTSSSYVASGGYVTAGSCPCIKIFSWIPSFANNANCHCCVHLSHESGGMTVGFSQNASMWREVNI